MHELGWSEDQWYALPRDERARHVAYRLLKSKADGITGHIISERRARENENKRTKGKR